MSFNNLKCVIELGNINIKCIIYALQDDKLEILSTSIFPSNGIHNGEVINLEKASKSIRSCISETEKKADTSIKKINVIVEQHEFLCTKFSKHRKINGSQIQKEDIDFLLNEGKKQVTLNDSRQSIIHIFNHNYIVDGKTFIEEPIDVYADYLSHEMTFITMPKNNIKNINQAFIDCDIEVERIISCTFALAAKLLSSRELQLGSTLIDIGYEKISLGLFKNLALVHSATLPLGVNHITKDISRVCSLDLEDSEIIRNKIDFSFQNNQTLFDKEGYLKNIYFKNSEFRKISKKLIFDIAKARLDEIFEMLKKQMILTNIEDIFIVGGGSNLNNLEKYCTSFFGINIKKKDQNNTKPELLLSGKDFSPCLGAIKIIKDGWETEAIPESANKYIQKTGLFAKIFGKFL